MKRILSLMLTFTLVFSLLNLTAFAAPGDNTGTTIELKIVPDITTATAGATATTIKYTVQAVVPTGNHVGVIEFNFDVPTGMTLSSEVNADTGYFFPTYSSMYYNAFTSTGGIFEQFAYTSASKHFIASGTTTERYLGEGTHNLMTIVATVPAGEAGTFELGVTSGVNSAQWNGTTTHTVDVQTTPVVIAGEVTPATLTSLEIVGDTTATVIPQGTATVNLSAKGTYSDNSVTNPETGVAWSIDPAVAGASISDSGVVSLEDNVSGNVVVKASKDGVNATDHTIAVTRPTPDIYQLIITGESRIDVPKASEGNETVTYTAEAIDQYGDNYPLAVDALSWSLNSPYNNSIITPTGITLVSATASTATLTVKPEASLHAQIDVRVAGGLAVDKHSIQILKDSPYAEDITIAGGFSSIAVPTVSEGGTVNGTAFTATATDQFGAPMTNPDITWSIPTTPGVSIDADTGVVTVTKDAEAAANIVVTATSGSATKTTTFEITKATPVATTIAIDQGDTDSLIIPSPEKTYTATVYDQYGKAMPSESISWGASSLPGVTVTEASVIVAEGADEGDITLTASVATDNTIYDTITITISSKLEATISNFANTTVTYGEGFTPLATSAEVDAADITYTYSDGLSAIDSTTDAGSYQVTVTAENATYYATKTIDVTVVGKRLTWATDGVANDKVYDGDTVTTAATLPTLEGIINGDTVEVDDSSATYNFADKNADTDKTITVTGFDIKGTDAGNYIAPTSQPNFGTADITKKMITVTAKDATREYSDADPAFDFTYTTGLVGSDTEAMLSVSLETTATATSDVGSYPITGTGTSTSGNYAVTVTPGTLSVTPTDYSGKTDMDSVGLVGIAGNKTELTEWKDLEGVSFTYLAKTPNNNTVIDGTPSISGNSIVYDLAASATVGDYIGEITVTVSSKNYKDFTATIDVSVRNEVAQTLTFDKTNVELEVDTNKTYKNTLSGALTTVSYVSSNPDVATVADDGTVTIVGVGTAAIAATAKEETISGVKYLSAMASYSLTVNAGEVSLLSDSITRFDVDYASLDEVMLIINDKMHTLIRKDKELYSTSLFPFNGGNLGKEADGSVIITLYKEFLATLPAGTTYSVMVTTANGVAGTTTATIPEKEMYTLTVVGGGTGATPSGAYEEGSIIDITAGTKDGYTFAGWTGTDVMFVDADSIATQMQMPSANTTITANWTADTDVPDTGDTANPMLLAIIFATSALGLGSVYVSKKRIKASK